MLSVIDLQVDSQSRKAYLHAACPWMLACLWQVAFRRSGADVARMSRTASAQSNSAQKEVVLNQVVLVGNLTDDPEFRHKSRLTRSRFAHRSD